MKTRVANMCGQAPIAGSNWVAAVLGGVLVFAIFWTIVAVARKPLVGALYINCYYSDTYSWVHPADGKGISQIYPIRTCRVSKDSLKIEIGFCPYILYGNRPVSMEIGLNDHHGFIVFEEVGQSNRIVKATAVESVVMGDEIICNVIFNSLSTESSSMEGVEAIHINVAVPKKGIDKGNNLRAYVVASTLMRWLWGEEARW